jgi:uncharacterized membrane protein
MGKRRNLKAMHKPPESANSPANPTATPTPDAPIKPKEQQLRESLKEAIGEVPNQEQVVERIVSVVIEEFFRGPLPHPRHLQAYEEICPGLSNRIVAMAETALNRAEDRRDKKLQVEIDDRRFEFEDRRRGMWLGFGALIAFLVTGSFVLWLDYPKIGAALLSAAAIGTVVLAFVNGRDRSLPTAAESPPARPSLWRRIADRLGL